MIEKEKIELLVRQWLVSGKPNQSIKLAQGWMLNISSIRCTTPEIIDYRFTLFSPNKQRFIWVSGEDIANYHDPYSVISEIIYDGFKGLAKSEGINIIKKEQLDIKEGNILQAYDKYTLPPSVDKENF
jgi:hypothetical protein